MSRKKSTDDARNIGTRGAAEILGVSHIRLKQLAAAGRIGQMVAGRYLFSRAELARFKKIPRPHGKRLQS